MRRICYSVAMSLDGYIAGPNGEYDWIVMDPDIDFGEMMNRFDTLLMGRGTFEVARSNLDGFGRVKIVVVSRTLRQEDHPGITILRDNVEAAVARLRESPGKDIWLFGGGLLFRSLLEAGLVDIVEVGLIPVLLGGGIAFLPPSSQRTKLQLIRNKLYPKTGILSLEYAVIPASTNNLG